jgi:hypothetical protein
MIPGSTVGREIGSKVMELGQTEERLGRQLTDLERKIAMAVTDQADDLGQVAGTLLHSDNVTPLKDYVHAARSKVEMVYARQQEERNRLEQYKKDLELKIKTASEQLSTSNAELKKLEETVQQIRAKSLEKAEKNPETKEMKGKLESTSKEIVALKRRQQELEILGKTKLPMLTSGKLFAYLQKVEAGAGITSNMDRWLAERSGYQDRKSKCALIQETCSEVLRRVKKTEETLNECNARIQKILVQTEREFRLEEAMQALTLGQSNRKRLQDQIAQDEKELKRSGEQQQKLLQGKDDMEVQAKGELKEALKAANIGDIVAAARATPGNNSLADRINARDEQIRNDRRQATQLKNELANVATQKQTVSSFENRFVSNGFNGSLSRFTNGFDINSVIGLLILNKISEHQAFNIFQQEHRHVEPPIMNNYTDQSSFRRQQSSSDSGFGFGSSSSDAGSWSTSGSDSGGGSSSSDSGSWSTTDSV